jgi:hypothetical protein
MLGLAYLTQDCWLEVSLHPEGHATGQFDQGFRGFPWSQVKCEVGTQNSTLACMLHMQPSKL